MLKLRLTGALEFRNDAVGKHFAEFDAPLVERIDIPDGTLDKDFVFVERDEVAKSLRCESLRKDGVGWAVAFEGTVWHLKCRDSVCRNFLRSFAKRKRLGLGKE